MDFEFHNISHTYDRNKVLDGIGLVARSGEVTCLLGPSGCGKTTLLKLAAGLMSVQEGQITLGGKVLARQGHSLPPEKRPVGLVFQEGALFPHLSVGENIGFGLKGTAAEKKDQVSCIMPKIGLTGFENRFPHTLSGGQQQRVALARALVPKPEVLLLDEPFANIDSQLRHDLREETRRMLKESGTTAILVTHDPEEALEMGDRIAVMDRGKIVQFDVPEILYDQPATAGIAMMFGRGQSLEAILTADSHLETSFGCWPASCLASDRLPPGKARLVARQDTFEVSAQANGWPIIDIRNAGNEQLLFVEGNHGDVIRVEAPRDQSVQVGTFVSLQPRNRSIFCFPPAC